MTPAPAPEIGVCLRPAGITVVARSGGGFDTLADRPLDPPFLSESWIRDVARTVRAAVQGTPPSHGRPDVVIEAGEVISDLLSPPYAHLLGSAWVVKATPRRPPGDPVGPSWPSWLRSRVVLGHTWIEAGTDLYGATVLPPRESIALPEEWDEAAPSALVICAAGSLFDPSVEFRIAERLAPRVDVPLVLSHDVGGRRLAEREAACILDAALLAPVGRLIDELSARLRAHVGLDSYVAADGARLRREEARAYPWRMYDTGLAALTLGAAARSGQCSAAVVSQYGGQVRLTQLNDGVLRSANHRVVAGTERLVAAQNHVGSSTLSLDPEGNLSPDVRRTLSDSPVPVVLVRPAGVDPAGTAGALRALEASSIVRTESTAVLRATGALFSHPLAEVQQFANGHNEEAIADARERVRALALARAASASATSENITVTLDQVVPLSFLSVGPIFLRCRAADTKGVWRGVDHDGQSR